MKSLEKVSKGKPLFLYIDHQNSFFDHPWWWKQIDTLLKDKGVKYTCVCKHQKAKKYFEEHNMPYEYHAPNRILHAMHMFGMLLFNFKKFHLSVFTKKSTISYIFIAWEIIGIGAIIYIMYQFLVPSTTILLQPAYSVEDVVYNFRYYAAGTTWLQDSLETNYITVPYQVGSITHTHTLSVPLQSLQYLSRPSAWDITVTNTLPIKFTLKQWTQFITDDGLIFLANYSFVLPPWSRQNPAVMRLAVTAADKDKDWNIIGERWNIGSWTRMLIKNLNQSAILWAVYGNVLTWFQWWYTKKWGYVTDDDISLIKQKLETAITGDNKKIIIKQEFHDEDGFLLPLNDMMKIENIQYDINASSWQQIDILEGKVTVTYRYPYVIWHDLMQWVDSYVKQRPSQTRQLISLQKNTATFYDTYKMQDYIVVPTKVSAVWWYDFKQDYNHIKSQITTKIAWLSTEEAKKVILSYPEISSVILKNSPMWSDTLPTLKSRIYFRTTTTE